MGRMGEEENRGDRYVRKGKTLEGEDGEWCVGGV
jgi:hypothetical protein